MTLFPDGREVMQFGHFPLIIDGEETEAVSGERFESVDPASGSPIATVARAGPADVDRAVDSARHAYRDVWRPMPVAERGHILRRISVLIREQADELSQLETLDTGKPLRESKADVEAAARYFDYYAGLADKLFGDTIPISTESFAYTVREPFGITGHITP
jgi:aldehyde dehydrogenase (NAD+)